MKVIVLLMVVDHGNVSLDYRGRQEREAERERERDRQTDRDRDRERKKERKRERERVSEGWRPLFIFTQTIKGVQL